MGNGAETKDKILQVALEIFANHGFEGARMEQISTAVGINKASLYFHFKSKEDIFRALFQKILSNYRYKIKNIINESKDLPIKDRLIEIYKRYLEYNWDNMEMDFWNRIYYFPPAMMKEEIIKETLNTETDFINNIISIFEDGINNKELKPLKASQMAKTYYYLITCIGLSSDFMLKDQGLEDMSECFSLFWEGIKGN